MLAVIKHSYIIIIIIISYFFILFFIFSDFLCFPNNTDNLRAYIILKKKIIITLNFLLTRVISSIIARISNLQ